MNIKCYVALRAVHFSVLSPVEVFNQCDGFIEILSFFLVFLQALSFKLLVAYVIVLLAQIIHNKYT